MYATTDFYLLKEGYGDGRTRGYAVWFTGSSRLDATNFSGDKLISVVPTTTVWDSYVADLVNSSWRGYPVR